MTVTRARLLSLLVGIALGAATEAKGQEGFEIPPTNPQAVVRQWVAATEIEVTYARPRVKGREIFGALVPFGRVWRTGADAATRIRFGTPVRFGGVAVEAGEYELFSVPGPAEWAVILQPAKEQWGSYAFDPANDVARVVVAARTLATPVESFTIAFDDVTASSATLAISWDRTRVDVPLSVDVRATVVPGIEALLAGDGRRPYFRAAMFFFDNDLDLERAEEWMRKALEPRPDHVGMLHRLALILERKGDRAAAIEVAERSLAAAAEQNPELRDEYTRLNEALLARLRQP